MRLTGTPVDMVGALKNLWNSEKGLVGGMLVISATVFVFLGRMNVEQWQEFATWVFGIYVGGKTVQGAVESASRRTANGIATSPSTDPTLDVSR